MSTISLVVIDDEFRRHIDSVVQGTRWQITPMGPFPREISNEWITARGGNLNNAPEQFHEFLILNVDYERLHGRLADSVAEPNTNNQLFWRLLEYNAWDGVDATVVVGYRTHRPIGEILDRVRRDMNDAPPADDVVVAPGPDADLWMDEDEDIDEYEEAFDDEYEEAFDDEYPEEDMPRGGHLPDGPAPFDIIAPGRTPEPMTEEDYNKHLQELSEVNMPLSNDTIFFRNPFTNCGATSAGIKDHLLEHFADFDRPITFLSPGAQAYFENPPDNHLYIIHFSTPNLAGTRSVNCNPQDFLTPLTNEQRRRSFNTVSRVAGFPPVEIPTYNESVIIEDPSTGFVMAQLFNQKYLYIYFQALSRGSLREYQTFNYIITSALASMSSLRSAIREKYQEIKNSIDKAIIDKREQELRDSLQRLFIGQILARKRELRDRIIACQRNIKSWQEKLSREYRTLSVKMAELDGVERKAKEQAETLDIGQFFDHPRIKKIAAISGGIALTTDLMYFTVPDNKLVFEVGVMEIQIFFDGNTAPHIFNKTRRVNAYENNMHHPHIFHRGDPCWGNVYETLIELYQQGDIKNYIDILIAYIETVNLRDSAGAKYYRWPVAPAEKQVIENWKQVAENVGKEKSWRMEYI